MIKEKENVLTLHRIFNAPAECIFNAFLDADALAKWLAPHGYTATINHLEPYEGGHYDITLTHFRSGRRYRFKGQYLEIKPNEFIRYTDQLCDDEDEAKGAMTEKMIELKPSFLGTELNITQTGLLEFQPKEVCYLDWQQSLYLLENLIGSDH